MPHHWKDALTIVASDTGLRQGSFARSLASNSEEPGRSTMEALRRAEDNHSPFRSALENAWTENYAAGHAMPWAEAQGL